MPHGMNRIGEARGVNLIGLTCVNKTGGDV